MRWVSYTTPGGEASNYWRNLFMRDQPRGDIPRGHDTRNIESRFGPKANEASFPEAEPGNGSGGVGPEFSIPDDRRTNLNGSPRSRK